LFNVGVPVRQGPGAPQQDTIQIRQLLCDLLGTLFSLLDQHGDAGLLLHLLALFFCA
jgi:hypothetical protein